MVRQILKTALFLVLSVAFAGCFQTRDDNRSIRIAALLKSSTNPFFTLMWEGIKKEAQRTGVQVGLFWPEYESDFRFQYRFLENEASNYDVLILSPSDLEGIYRYLPKVREGGTYIIILDVEINLPDGADERNYFDVFAGTDNEAGGLLAAEYARRYVSNDSNIAIIGGFPETMNKPGRVISFENRIRELFPNITIKKYTADYEREKARGLAKRITNFLIRCDLIYCANDHMALGVLDALEQASKQKLPHIIGYDSIKEAQQAILDGRMDASISQFPAVMGAEAVKAAVALLNGEYVPRRILIKPEISIRKQLIESVKMSDLME